MKTLTMTKADLDALYAGLAHMPDFLTDTFGALSTAEAASSLSAEIFSPVEHCWHLADLEREGFAVRIHRLLNETHPSLADFDGGRIAEERQYKQKSLTAALAAFRQARLENLALLGMLQPDDWQRQGEQEGVGVVALCDIPALMAAHDAAHRAEINEWLREAGI
jgi:hypothetical protein